MLTVANKRCVAAGLAAALASTLAAPTFAAPLLTPASATLMPGARIIQVGGGRDAAIIAGAAALGLLALGAAAAHGHGYPGYDAPAYPDPYDAPVYVQPQIYHPAAPDYPDYDDYGNGGGYQPGYDTPQPPAYDEGPRYDYRRPHAYYVQPDGPHDRYVRYDRYGNPYRVGADPARDSAR